MQRTRDRGVVGWVQPPQRAVEARRLAEVVRLLAPLQGGDVGHALVALLRYGQLPLLGPVYACSVEFAANARLQAEPGALCCSAVECCRSLDHH